MSKEKYRCLKKRGIIQVQKNQQYRNLIAVPNTLKYVSCKTLGVLWAEKKNVWAIMGGPIIFLEKIGDKIQKIKAHYERLVHNIFLAFVGVREKK